MAKKGISRDRIISMLCDLAFAPANDAVKLAYLEPEELGKIDRLNLSGVAGVHRLSNGSVELKLIDREKLIALLLEATADREEKGGLGSLIDALDSAAGKVYSGGGAGEDGSGAL